MRAYFRFLKENARWLVGGLLLTISSSFGQTFFISIFSPELRNEFSLTDGEFGRIYMIGTLASALTLPMLGKVVDRYSVAHVAAFVICAFSLACIGMATVSSVLMLVLVIYSLRLFGQGMMTHTAMTAMGRWYERERGRAVSVTSIGHHIGEGVLPLLAVLVVGWIGWRQSWFLAAAALLFVFLPTVYFLMREERIPRSSLESGQLFTGHQWTRAEVLRDPVFYVLCLGVLAPAFIGTSFFFHQVHIAEIKGWSRELVASSFILMAITTATFNLLTGFLIDRFSAARILPVFLIPLAIGSIVLGWFDAPMTIYVYMILLGISYGFSSAVFSAIWPEVYGIQHLGSVRSMVVAAMVFSSALGPGVTGWFIDLNVSFETQLYYMAAYCLTACAGMLIVSRRLVERSKANKSS